jgi:ribosomal protein S18 acetylase RimI-like enzyme
VTSELNRALAFEEALRARCAERVVPFRFGHAFFNDTFAAVWDLNHLRVERLAGASADALAAEAERLHGEAGQGHRRVVVPDEEAGEALAAAFMGLGWDAHRFLYMAWRGPGERAGDPSLAEEVEGDAVRALRVEVARKEPWASDEVIVQTVLDGNRLVAERGRARHFAVRADGAFVSTADLYAEGGVAQVEDVVTSPAHRGRGHASAAIARAVEDALAGGAELVFLVADDEDWPKALYARLGFEPIGRTWAFLRTPAPPTTG